MARARGINKAQGYLARVFTVEYDMKGMLDAYGLEFVLEFAKLVHAGKIDCRQCVDQWASDRALYEGSGSLNVSDWFATKGEQFLVDDIDIMAA